MKNYIVTMLLSTVLVFTASAQAETKALTPLLGPKLLVKVYCGGSWDKDCGVSISSPTTDSRCNIVGHVDGGPLPKDNPRPRLKTPSLFKVECPIDVSLKAAITFTGEVFAGGSCTLNITTNGSALCSINKRVEGYEHAGVDQSFQGGWHDTDGSPLVSITYSIEKIMALKK